MQKDDAQMNDCPWGADNSMGKYAVCKMVLQTFCDSGNILQKIKNAVNTTFGLRWQRFL